MPTSHINHPGCGSGFDEECCQLDIRSRQRSLQLRAPRDSWQRDARTRQCRCPQNCSTHRSEPVQGFDPRPRTSCQSPQQAGSLLRKPFGMIPMAWSSLMLALGCCLLAAVAEPVATDARPKPTAEEALTTQATDRPGTGTGADAETVRIVTPHEDHLTRWQSLSRSGWQGTAPPQRSARKLKQTPPPACSDPADCGAQDVTLEEPLQGDVAVTEATRAPGTPSGSVPVAGLPAEEAAALPEHWPQPEKNTTGERMINARTGRMYWMQSPGPIAEGAAGWKYELDTMLGMSFFFYEVNRAGPLPASTRPPWRGDTLLAGGVSIDGSLQGGYYDGGDHTKFMLPQAFTIGRLNWLAHEFYPALNTTYFDGMSNFVWAREAAKWGADFLVKATSSNQVLMHVGDTRQDHWYIGRGEYYPKIDRDIQWCNPGECSDIAGAVAGALAHASLTFWDVPELSSKYWNKSREAYAQTGAASGTFVASSTTYAPVGVYYPSSAPVSHTFFAAASMYLVCMRLPGRCTPPETSRFLQDALKLGVMKEPDGGQKWYWEVPGWDNAWWDAAAIMLSLGQDGPQSKDSGKHGHFKFALSRFAGIWTQGKSPIEPSPLGHRFVLKWGSNRHALNGAALLLKWAALPESARTGSTAVHDAQCAAVKQVHYVAGDNDRGSYVAGFGINPPSRPHHRNSACTPWEHEGPDKGGTYCLKYFFDSLSPEGNCNGTDAQSDGTCYADAQRPNPFVIHGALVGGPKTPTDAGSQERTPYSEEGYNDWRTDWVGNENALDYNSLYTMALAAAAQLPATFWATAVNCTGINDLQLQTQAGPHRTPPTPGPGDDVYTFKTFQAFDFTRTLESDWMYAVP